MLEMDGCHILIWWQGYSTNRFPRWPPIFTGGFSTIFPLWYFTF